MEGLFWVGVFFFCLLVIRLCHVFYLKLTDFKKCKNKKKEDAEENSVDIGKRGETEVFRALLQTHSAHKKIINDIVIKTADGKMSQIDHILINESGIFVIETKNYKGAIYGSDGGLHWYQYLNGKKFKFYNPVKQNAAHMKRLAKILGDIYPYYSIIVFVKDNTKKINIDNVINLSDLVRYIDAHQHKNLSREDIRLVYKRLQKMKKKNYKHTFWDEREAA